jgi:hypothetical protein
MPDGVSVIKVLSVNIHIPNAKRKEDGLLWKKHIQIKHLGAIYNQVQFLKLTIAQLSGVSYPSKGSYL